MKKLAIVSCYFQNNYGSMLQAFATQYILDKLGVQNETICIDGFSKEIKKKKFLYFAKASITSTFLGTKIGRVKSRLLLKITRGDYANNLRIRNKAFNAFKSQHFRLSPKFGSLYELSQECSNLYHTVLVGSDQLWLPGNIAADYYTLSFAADSVNTVAYATSFGQNNLPSNIVPQAKSFLSKIKFISTREYAGQNIVYQLTGRKVPVVCDPTFLLSADEWMTIQKQEPIVSTPYILCYFLGNNPKHRLFAQKLKEQTGYMIVSLPHIDEYVKMDDIISDYRLYDVTPADFLNLVRNAKYVCTDSFHCSVFSIIYRKIFFTFERFSNKNKQSTNNRLTTLFSATSLENRLILDCEFKEDLLNCDIDYDKVHRVIEDMRNASLKYLVSSIEAGEKIRG